MKKLVTASIGKWSGLKLIIYKKTSKSVYFKIKAGKKTLGDFRMEHKKFEDFISRLESIRERSNR